MSFFGTKVRQAEQSVANCINLNLLPYLPSVAAFKNALDDLAKDLRGGFGSRFGTKLLHLVRSVIIDGLSLKF